MIDIYTKGSYLRRSCNKDTENAKYPSADSITDTRRCEIFSEVNFSRSSLWLASVLSLTVITTALDLIRH